MLLRVSHTHREEKNKKKKKTKWENSHVNCCCATRRWCETNGSAGCRPVYSPLTSLGSYVLIFPPAECRHDSRTAPECYLSRHLRRPPGESCFVLQPSAGAVTCIRKKIASPPIPLPIRPNFDVVRRVPAALPPPSPTEPFLTSLSTCFKVMNPNYKLRV